MASFMHSVVISCMHAIASPHSKKDSRPLFSVAACADGGLGPRLALFGFLFLPSLLVSRAAYAYIPGDRWTTTAAGAAGIIGDPITIRWSIVRDGTLIPGEEPSNFISYLDGIIGGGMGGSDLTQRPWFPLLAESFGRWNAVGGINFVYEPADDGTQLERRAGAAGVRGDMRIGGALIDGASSTLAYAFMPNNGDMVFDTGETTFYANASNNYRALRNVLMHETGHAFGLDHVESSTERFLMEPFINLSIDGPQLDDIRGVQGMYGDALEKSNNLAGNDTFATATPLGILSGGTLTIGEDAASGQLVLPTESDFVSIASSLDVDWFSFRVTAESTLDAVLTPLGGVFNQGSEDSVESPFDANARSDLTLALFGGSGATLLATANDAPAGQTESITAVTLRPDEPYYVRVTGSTSNVQMYELSFSVVQPVPGDFDEDLDVDGHDFLLWQQQLGLEGAGLAADGDKDEVVSGADLDLWREHFGETQVNATPNAGSVPEPAAAALAVIGMLSVALNRCRSLFGPRLTPPYSSPSRGGDRKN
jgi:hypothetical protein